MGIAQYFSTFGGQDQLPQDDTMMQLELKRKFAMADALKGQATPQGQMVGDRYVAPSWTQHLANALGKVTGAMQEQNAIKQYGDYQTAEKARMADALKTFGQAFEPTTKTETTYAPGIGKELAVGDTVQTAPNFSPTSNANEMVAPTSPFGTQNMTGNAMTSVPTTTTSTVQPTDESIRQAYIDYADATKKPQLIEALMTGEFEARRKRNDPYDLAAGAKRFEGGTNRLIAENPKQDSESISNLEKEYRFAQKGGYQGSPEDWKRISSEMTPAQRAQLDIAMATFGLSRDESIYKYGSPTPPMAKPKSVTMNDVNETARNSGKPVAQVIKDFKAQGITVQGVK
jgi:hypothetical protein